MDIALIPRWMINLVTSKSNIQYEVNILISNVFVILLFIVLKDRIISLMNIVPHVCIFDWVTNIECPVCGTTRAFCEIVKGNFSIAAKLNVSSFFVVLYILSQVPLRIIAICNPSNISIIHKWSRIFGVTVISVILINWLVNVFF